MASPIPLTLFSCGPVDKAEPPELKGGALGIISPYDTVSIEFTTRIPSISASQIQSDLPVNLKAVGSGQTWKIFGDTSILGRAYFVPDTSYEILLSEIDDGEAVQNESQRITFETLPILDKDFSKDSLGTVIDNNNRGDADMLGDSVRFFNKALLTKGISFAGLITSDLHAKVTDNVDWFSVWLSAKDTLHLELAGFSQDLDLAFEGPADPQEENLYDWGTLEIEKAGSTESLTQFITLDAADFGVGGTGENLTKPMLYWIGVKAGAGFKAKSMTPYTLTVKVAKKQ